jgi:hypothetical protein
MGFCELKAWPGGGFWCPTDGVEVPLASLDSEH